VLGGRCASRLRAERRLRRLASGAARSEASLRSAAGPLLHVGTVLGRLRAAVRSGSRRFESMPGTAPVHAGHLWVQFTIRVYDSANHVPHGLGLPSVHSSRGRRCSFPVGLRERDLYVPWTRVRVSVRDRNRRSSELARHLVASALSTCDARPHVGAVLFIEDGALWRHEGASQRGRDGNGGALLGGSLRGGPRRVREQGGRPDPSSEAALATRSHVRASSAMP
jgi:hypothetical protein